MMSAENSKNSSGGKVAAWLRLLLATAALVLLLGGSLAGKAGSLGAAKDRAIESYQAFRIAYQLNERVHELEKQEARNRTVCSVRRPL